LIDEWSPGNPSRDGKGLRKEGRKEGRNDQRIYRRKIKGQDHTGYNSIRIAV
jgi:hypothetical protein